MSLKQLWRDREKNQLLVRNRLTKTIRKIKMRIERLSDLLGETESRLYSSSNVSKARHVAMDFVMSIRRSTKSLQIFLKTGVDRYDVDHKQG